MQIHQIKPNKSKKGIKRIGRGGKRGTYSGKGQKGQRSRAGHNIRPGLRDVIIRTPKLRGFSNKIKNTKPIVLKLEWLNRVGEKEITREILVKYGINKPAKIVGGGKLNEVKNIVGIKMSRPVRKEIEKMGGTVK